MSWVLQCGLFALLWVLALASYIDRMYFEMGKFLSREYEENIDAWERRVEPKLMIGRDSAAISASLLRQIAMVALAFVLALRLRGTIGHSAASIGRTVFELLLTILIFDRVIPELFFTRTRGQWIVRIAWMVQGLFYLVLPITLTIGLLLSIVGLAEPEAQEPEHPSEAMDALLEAGEEEGILEESDRELVRSVVEFGDKVVREVMVARPAMLAVPGTMTLEEFTAEVNENGFSRVPVYAESIDHITGVAFARDLLAVRDEDARRRTVATLQKPTVFVPETKKVNELLREMQRQKQHMSIVIDEYGGVAGLVTIEDLLEAIVGNIEDEHDTSETQPIEEPEGTWLVPGDFEVDRLRELFSEREEPAKAAILGDGDDPPLADEDQEREEDEPSSQLSAEQLLAQVLDPYDATTVGGLVSEIAGHIPLPGEVVEDGPLRLEVVASTDRTVERVRVALSALNESEPE
ncbi:Hemolysin, contains CBS domains [Bryocella elongata]|uniref:Hemolysin, contains CBS domains n=1 Tax=Bryocella elongata TaxID=863522 RepID=A0A1H5S994_9BACT|nr:hemolysin family protein [Bryocella elongata]SEF47045.1 Hemolysin, contains CBS domains [Bryocella elongata]